MPLDVIAVFPLEILSLAAGSTGDVWVCATLLRCNRLIKTYKVWDVLSLLLTVFDSSTKICLIIYINFLTMSSTIFLYNCFPSSYISVIWTAEWFGIGHSHQYHKDSRHQIGVYDHLHHPCLRLCVVSSSLLWGKVLLIYF